MDITKHLFVPKHLKASETEKEALLKAYKVQLIDLPKILHKDQALAKLNLKSGDLVRIERNSKTAGLTNYYRVVIDG